MKDQYTAVHKVSFFLLHDDIFSCKLNLQGSRTVEIERGKLFFTEITPRSLFYNSLQLQCQSSVPLFILANYFTVRYYSIVVVSTVARKNRSRIRLAFKTLKDCAN